MRQDHDTEGGDRGEIKEFRLLEVQSKPISLQMSLFANGEFHICTARLNVHDFNSLLSANYTPKTDKRKQR
jgi:hypothetical protein